MLDATGTLDHKLHAAIRAGWRTLFLGLGIIALQWIAYLAIAAARPAWFLSLWGRDITWQQVQSIWIAAMVVLKVCMFVLLLVIVWASWWRSGMAKRA